MPLLIDGHLDIAMNALRYERDQRQPVEAIRKRESQLEGNEPGTCTMTAEQMRRSGVPLCVTTVIARCKPGVEPHRRAPRYGLDHPTQDMAFAAAWGQLGYYESLQRQDVVRIIDSAAALDDHWSRWRAAAEDHTSPDDPPPLGLIITMEGADPLVEPHEIHLWWKHGLRTLMLAHFQQSCYAYGTPNPKTREQGPLTNMGRALLNEMAKLNMPLDLTHLCDQSFAEAVDLFGGSIYSSHSNCRALADAIRQLTDEQIKTIGERDGVMGLAIHNWMLAGNADFDPPREQVGLARVADHVDHICQVTGSVKHAAIGSDLDGGYGREDCPHDLNTIADVHRLADILAGRGFNDVDIDALFHGNWLRFWQRNLPAK